MNVDDIKDIWKNDMSQLEARVMINEEKINQLKFDKAQSSFDKLFKISLAGKNMALIYALASLVLIYLVRDSALYMAMLGAGAGLMVFSYFQHSVLKKLDYASLSIVALQKEIYNFRKHTAQTAIYDVIIVAIWLVTASLAYLKWAKGFDIFNNPEQFGTTGVAIAVMILFLIFTSKAIYKAYDVKLKESEETLDLVVNFEKN